MLHIKTWINVSVYFLRSVMKLLKSEELLKKSRIKLLNHWVCPHLKDLWLVAVETKESRK